MAFMPFTLMEYPEGRALQHIAHEFDMLAHASSRTAQARLESDRAGEILFLEATLLHLRTVTEFLLGRPMKEGAIYDPSARRWGPRDFTARTYADRWQPPDSDAARELDKRLPMIDKYLSHLSRERATTLNATTDQPTWNAPLLASAAIEVLHVFVATLDDSSPYAEPLRSIAAQYGTP